MDWPKRREAEWADVEETKIEGTSLNKTKPKRQILYSLFTTAGEETGSSKEMMHIAKSHHERLQSHPPMTHERKTAIQEILNNIKQELTNEEAEPLQKEITTKEIQETIKRMAAGKAPGPDGIPLEFWKQELEWTRIADRAKQKRPNIVQLMHKVLLDIDEYGPIDEKFSEARMSLLYKKKDKRDIANYRPITLLNTDYKIYTSILTLRMGQVATKIINKDQAGFMKGRLIYDQTKLTELVIHLCETRGQNGNIIALDQEKAYDRIDHAYLWEVMERYKIPTNMIRRVQNLYQNAQTAIKLNGHTSEPFKVARGVRQGDPLSCLLYNIAIEPLFETIRTSPIKGIYIHENSEEAKLSAYADDTTVYLDENDEFSTLQKCLDLFCTASTARFNMDKTEVIPVGTTEHRTNVIATRIVNGQRMDDKTKIANEGEAIRILGSYQGNHATAQFPWESILSTQNKIMRLWAPSYPSASGRVMITKSLIVSRALYLMTVNGITPQYLEQMERAIRKFIWQGKKGPISWDRATQPKKYGGIGAPCVKTLYEASLIMWIKRWLKPQATRPKWAFALNSIIQDTIEDTDIERDAVTEWIEQKWNAKPRAGKLPEAITKLLKTAKKHNTQISTIRASEPLKLNMPAFYHPGTNRHAKNNTKTARCLRENHRITTIETMRTFANANPVHRQNECTNAKRCITYTKTQLNKLPNMWNPNTHSPKTPHLYHTPRRIKQNMDTNIKESTVTFNPDPRTGNETLENIRIFCKNPSYKDSDEKNTRNPVRTNQGGRRNEQNNRTITLYTDGSTIRNGYENGASGIGIWHEPNSVLNTAMKLQGKTHTNQRAELAAIAQALRLASETPLIICSDSLTSLTMICKNIRKAEDKNWIHTANSDILREILARLRTRRNTCEFKWVKGHAENEGNNEADRLANEGRSSETEFNIEMNERLKEALHDGARLQALEMKDIYATLLRKKQKENIILHQERIEDAQIMIEQATELKPSTEDILKGTWKIPIQPRARDHIWTLITGTIKSGNYWKHIPGFEHRAQCYACWAKTEDRTEETLQHIWIECPNNGQKKAWEKTKAIWNKTSRTRFPDLSLGILRGAGSITIGPPEDKNTHIDSKRIRIMIAITLWTIWKTRNEIAINERLLPDTTAATNLTESLKQLITTSWQSTQFYKESTRNKKSRHLRKLWSDIAVFPDKESNPPVFRF